MYFIGRVMRTDLNDNPTEYNSEPQIFDQKDCLNGCQLQVQRCTFNGNGVVENDHRANADRFDSSGLQMKLVSQCLVLITSNKLIYRSLAAFLSDLVPQRPLEPLSHSNSTEKVDFCPLFVPTVYGLRS